MLIKKADVKNHLAAKLRKHHILQDLAGGQIPAERSSVADDGTVVTANGSSEDPVKSSSEFLLPIRPSSGH